ncbi:MAG: amidohydrolase family protein [Planctomycetota bacterium]
MNASFEVLRGCVVVRDGVIEQVLGSEEEAPRADRVLDLEGRTLVPGFVQSHIHCCQTLLRGMADDLALLDWLRQRVWPLEAAHDPQTLGASARLTALELLLGGTTAVLTMETVRHTDSVFEALRPLPIRAVVGKCLMDRGQDVPAGLLESKEQSLREALLLAARFPADPGARLRACLAPRFALSCSEGLLREIAQESERTGLLVHTHGAEQKEEVKLVQQETGRRNIDYLQAVGLVSSRLRLAHAGHLSPKEERTLAACGSHVLHCASSNLKLGSGIAPIHRYLESGIPVSIGADAAPCNNNLDALREARLASLLQKSLCGPTTLPARTALELLTIGGARALGMEQEIGSIEPGKRADLVEFDLHQPHIVPAADPYSQLIYAADRSDITRVYVDGEVVVEHGQPLFCDPGQVLEAATQSANTLATRAGLAR